MTLREAYKYGTEKLQESGITNAKQDSFYLLEFVTGFNRAKYYANEQRKMSKEEQKEYTSLIDKRRSRVPLQHIIGITEFMGLPIEVNSHVLIPRQETEVLGETALEIIAKNKISERIRILDMGTGSGCILISTLYYAKKEFPEIVGVGVDISKEAIEVSKKNALRNGFRVTKVELLKDLVYNYSKDSNNEPQIILIESDLFDELDTLNEGVIIENIRGYEKNIVDTNDKGKEIKGKYNIILSNPPYIPTNQIDSLEEEVKCHDPILALDGREDGLYYYRQIIKKSRKYLVEDGVLIFEIGWNQGEAVSKMMIEEGFVDVKTIKDLSGLDRVVLGSNERKEWKNV
jgi:release factor glutamine methyltransferase